MQGKFSCEIFKKMKYGEIIELGNHKLMCGDATKKEDVEKLIGNNHAKILFTSPPYSDIRNYHGCNIDIDYLKKFIPACKDFCDCICVNLGYKRKNFEIITYWDSYIKEAKENGLKLLAWNVWDKKTSGAIGQRQYFFPLRHEFIFVFGEKPYKLNKTIPKKHFRVNERTFSYVREKDGSLSKTTAKINNNEKNKELESVVAINREYRNANRKLHPSVFPVELPLEYIKAMTNESDVVLDCFCGSGTTLIACEMTNRKCLCMEISPEYCEVIIQRYRNLAPLFNN